MKASQRRLITAAVAILIVVVAGLVIRNCGGPQEPIKIMSGQSRSMGSIKWSVVSVMKVRTIGSSDATLSANGWFLAVDLYLTNQSKEKIQFDPESVVVTDGAGKIYSPSTKATAAQVKSQANADLNSIFNAALNPGKQQRLIGVFDISETATKLQMKVLGDKYGSRQDLVIELGF